MAMKNGVKSAADFYNQWIEDVKASVPEDRLLIHNAKDGWAPLCRFLNVPIPENSYPRINDKQQFQDIIKYFMRMGYLFGYFIPSVTIACLFYYLFHC